MKKILLAVLMLASVLCLVFGAAACGETGGETAGSGSQTEQQQPGNQGSEQKPDEGGQGSEQKPDEGGQSSEQKPDEGGQSSEQKPDEGGQSSEQKPDEGGQSSEQKPDEGQGGGQGDTPAAHVHSYGEWNTVVPATHLQAGTRRKYCSCGEYIEEPIAKTTAHEYGEWRTTEEATCTNAGKKQRECPCGDVQYESVPQKDHSFVDCVCSVCGTVESGAVEVKVYIDNQYQSSLYAGASTGYKIQLPDYWENHRYFDGWYANTEYMEPLTGDETYQTSSVIYARWIPFLNYKASVNAGEAKIEKCYTTTATAVAVPNGYLDYPITSIAADAFKGMTTIRWLIICSPMRTIGSSAFEGCNSMKKVVLPSSLTSIGERAFYGCSSVEKLEIPDSVTSIGNFAFCGCSGLTSVTIGSGMTSIGRYAFEGCSGLTGNLKIPDSVTSIGSYAFAGCSGLTGIQVETNNPIYHADENCLIETKSKTLIVGCKTSKIPDDESVTSIGDGAFSGCSGLTGTLRIPNSVTSIGSFAFCDCSGLTSVTIGSGVTWIGEYAFCRCYNLQNVIFNDPNNWYYNNTLMQSLNNPAEAVRLLRQNCPYAWKKRG